MKTLLKCKVCGFAKFDFVLEEHVEELEYQPMTSDTTNEKDVAQNSIILQI